MCGLRSPTAVTTLRDSKSSDGAVDSLLPTGAGAHAAWGITARDAADFGGEDIEKPLFVAGDAMLFDHLLVHRTAFDTAMTREGTRDRNVVLRALDVWAMFEENDVGIVPRDQIPILY